MPTRVKYDMLPLGAHTVVPTEDLLVDVGTGRHLVTGYTRVELNDIVEVDDLTDPLSERAYQVRGHLEGFGTPGQLGYQRPLATLLHGKD